jgi:hypothetical protein
VNRQSRAEEDGSGLFVRSETWQEGLPIT